MIEPPDKRENDPMTTKTSTLTDFLLARIAEDEAQEVAQAREQFMDGLPDEVYVPAALSHEKLMSTQFLRLDWALRSLGWALVAHLVPPVARRRAARYADHPDFRDEWRP